MSIESIGMIDPVLQFVDGDGAPYAAGSVTFYTVGTLNLLNIYSDQALTVPLPNPLPLNAAGRSSTSITGTTSPVYFQVALYDYVLKDANGVSIYGPITFSGSQWPSTGLGTSGYVLTSNGTTNTPSFQAIPAADNAICDFRLTLTSVTPVTTTDVTGAATIYCTPYRGNRIALYDGANWQVISSAEVSLALGTLTSGKPYDVYAYSNAGTVTLEFLVWTNDTTRATALTTLNGVLVKTGALTRRYMGTFYTTAATTTEDSFAKRFLWNYYNRVPRLMRVTDATNSWAYSSATYQQANASAANQIDMVLGVAEEAIHAEVSGLASNTGGGSNQPMVVAVGQDGITRHTNCIGGLIGTLINSSSMQSGGVATLDIYPAVGRHYYTWLEANMTGSGTGAFFGDNGATLVQSGISGRING